MKYLFVLLVLGLALNSFGQNRYHISETLSVDEVYYLKKDRSLLNGVIYKEYDNGQMVYESNYKNGKRDGLQRFWYKNGQMWYEYNYKDGKRDGLCRWWHDNGQLDVEENFKYGKQITKKCWGKDGKEINCPCYDEAGIEIECD